MKQCDYHHLNMCPRSLETKEFPSKGRCDNGYHVRGTIVVSSNDTESKVRAVKDSAKPSTKPSKSTQEEKADQTENLRDFLGMVIRKELKSILFNLLKRQV